MLTLIKIFFFFVVLVFLGGIVARYMMRRFFKKMQNNMNQGNTQQERQKKEGKVTLEYDKRKKGKKRLPWNTIKGRREKNALRAIRATTSIMKKSMNKKNRASPLEERPVIGTIPFFM